MRCLPTRPDDGRISVTSLIWTDLDGGFPSRVTFIFLIGRPESLVINVGKGSDSFAEPGLDL